LFSLFTAYLLIDSSSNMDITFILIAALGGLTTAINTWVNYQERDSKKLTVVDDEVHALRQALLDEERALTLSHSYGTIELETQPSSGRTPTPVV
jgi:hypothetical protein